MTVRPDVRASIAARDLDNSDLLEEISSPVLVSQGEEDIVVLPSMAKFILDNCGVAEGSYYEGVGHGPFIEDVDRFNAELTTFVDKVV
ncbi:MAG: hypothetical protein CMO22_08340 [Thiotrichales bacterium]|nr:hypothetical protein [Thiotrichales bacterium]OUX49321.1 MAG: hypothetical protein CBE42_07685 [Methylococcaceae bacterium TMED282]